MCNVAAPLPSTPPKLGAVYFDTHDTHATHATHVTCVTRTPLRGQLLAVNGATNIHLADGKQPA
jgi:hypothetical protein